MENINKYENILLASFLQDIGKPLERSKYFTLPRDIENKDTKCSHPKYSASLLIALKEGPDKIEIPALKELVPNIPYFQGAITDEVIELVLYHHNPKNVYQKILQLADLLSLSERECNEKSRECNEESRETYYKTPLFSIFNQISLQDEQNIEIDYQYRISPLNFNQILPEKKVVIDNKDYEGLSKEFLKTLRYVTDFEKLYYLFEKYFSLVPAQTGKFKPDISLFDHSKITSAIAVCLYEDYISNYLTKQDIENKGDFDKNAFTLIGGDLSGIQRFIFNIPSKGAAKSLKGRSVYLELLTRYVAKYILDRLDLPITNLLYNGGGNFYILAPYKPKESLDEIRRYIAELLLNAHQGDLYMAISWVPITIKEVKDFSKAQEKLFRESEYLSISELKSKKWSEVGLRDNYDKIFGPLDDGIHGDKYCGVCGRSDNLIKKENGEFICTLCDSFIKLTNKVKKATFMVEKKVEPKQNQCDTYENIFRNLGYEVDFVRKIDKREEQKGQKIYKLNDFDFEEYDGFIWASYRLPEEGFEEIAETAGDENEEGIGDTKLAYLKLDVDNLGKIFRNGFGEGKRLSRIVTLSRMLGLYFEGYLRQLIKEKGLEESLYVVFSGGDDTFIIGAWDKVLYFLKAFRDKFKEFVAYNSDITFSASIGIFDTHYPVSRGSKIAEERLEKAKEFKYKEEEKPKKNKVTVFDEVFSWKEYGYILEIWELLKRLIIEKGESRNILQKVIRSSKGLNKLLEKSFKGRIEAKKVWRLAYYLRDIKDKKDRNELVNIYEKMILENVFRKEKIKNPMIIPISARLAELSTKKRRENG